VRYTDWVRAQRAARKLPGHCKQCGKLLLPPAVNELDCPSCNPSTTTTPVPESAKSADF
jgi:uncharacterized OB-fold protein